MTAAWAGGAINVKPRNEVIRAKTASTMSTITTIATITHKTVFGIATPKFLPS
jgi:hypothetical protein